MSSSFKKRIIRELVVKGRYAQGVKILGEKQFKMFLKVWVLDLGKRAKRLPSQTVTDLIEGIWTSESWIFSITMEPNQAQAYKDRIALYQGISK